MLALTQRSTKSRRGSQAFIHDDRIDPREYANAFVQRFTANVSNRIDKLT
jgi:hypothetical protein